MLHCIFFNARIVKLAKIAEMSYSRRNFPTLYEIEVDEYGIHRVTVP